MPRRVQSLATLVGAPTESRVIARTRDWQTVLRLLARTSSPELDAEGQMSDAMLEEVSGVEAITALNLYGSRTLTDEGVRHLARLPNLRHLNLGGTAITDGGLAVLRDLPKLETISLAMTQVTDAGVAYLAHCEELREGQPRAARVAAESRLARGGCEGRLDAVHRPDAAPSLSRRAGYDRG